MDYCKLINFVLSFALGDCFDSEVKPIELCSINISISIIICSTLGNIIERILFFRIRDDIMLNVVTRHTKIKTK